MSILISTYRDLDFCAVFKRSRLAFTVIKVLFTFKFKDKLRTQDILFPSLIF